MLKVYTRINNQMAQYDADTDHIHVAWNMVNKETGNTKKNIPIMVLVPVNEELNRFTRPLLA
jgi:hypothetical protein